MTDLMTDANPTRWTPPGNDEEVAAAYAAAGGELGQEILRPVQGADVATDGSEDRG